MYNFFAEENSRQGDCFFIGGADFNHIKNVLRMQKGETFLVSQKGQSHLCRLLEFTENCAVAEIIEENYKDTELSVKLHLYQGLPKSDKMELIIQKCVELGVFEITPVEMSRCVVKLDDKKKKSKKERWQAVSESAAKQSKRNLIPAVCDVCSFQVALEKAHKLDILLVPYENQNGMKATKAALSKIKSGMSIGILIGPEGGFEQSEVDAAVNAGGIPMSLGKRILRTETAAIAATTMCMLYAETNLDGEKNEKPTDSI